MVAGEGEVDDRIEILMAACDCLCLVDASLQVFQQQILLLTDPKSMQSCLSLILRFSFKSLLKIQSNLRLALFSHFSTASVSRRNTASG